MDQLEDLLFNQAEEAILILDQQDCIIRANPKACGIFGFSCSELAGRPINSLGMDVLDTAFQEITSLDGKKFLLKPVYRELSSQGHSYKILNLQNLSERERDIHWISDATTLNSLPVIADPPSINIWSIDRDYRYTFFNESHKKAMKLIWNADIAIGSRVTDYITDPSYKQRVIDNYTGLLSGESGRSIDKLILLPGKDSYYENFGHPIYDSSNNIIGGMVYTVDITNRIELEKRLRSNIALLESIVNSPESVIILSIDTEYHYLFFNNAHRKAMMDIWGTEPKLGFSVLDFLPDPANRRVVRQFYARAFNGENPTVITNYLDSSGKQRYYNNICAAIYDPAGNINGITVFILDITELVKAEKQIKESLKEKELLLKEIHHRVKNNFQLITSILELQYDSIFDEKARGALKESQVRINAMSLIHSALYQGESLSEIAMSKYIGTLVSYIEDFYTPSDKTIVIHSKIEEIRLDIERAIPIGLIINELVTNSMKYAFPDRREGQIWLTLGLTPGGRIHLQVKDNGAGLPEDFDISKPKGLGTLIVTSLVSQLEGDISYNRGTGTVVEIFF